MPPIMQKQQDPLPEVVMPRLRVEKLLKGQKALVSGANSGIGKAIALALGQAGADVAVNYVSRKNTAEAVVKEIESSGSRALAIRADVSKEDQGQGKCSRR